MDAPSCPPTPNTILRARGVLPLPVKGAVLLHLPIVKQHYRVRHDDWGERNQRRAYVGRPNFLYANLGSHRCGRGTYHGVGSTGYLLYHLNKLKKKGEGLVLGQKAQIMEGDAKLVEKILLALHRRGNLPPVMIWISDSAVTLRYISPLRQMSKSRGDCGLTLACISRRINH